MTTINPQRKQQPVAEIPQVTADDVEPELSEDQQIESVPPADTIAPEQVATVDPSTTSQEIPNPSDVVAADAELTGDEAVKEPLNNPGVPVINAESVKNSVTAYVATYKGTLTNDWLAACLRYQNEHGVNSCPPGEDGKSEATQMVAAATRQMFGAYVSGASTNVRVLKQLITEMDAMRPYLQDNSIMGELARQRYDLAEANYCLMNSGCRGISLNTSESFATAVSNEGGIAILSFDLGGISLFSGLVSLSFRDGLKFGGGEASSISATPFIPYRFTGTRTNAAEDEDKNEFTLEAPLFPIRK